ncbi:MAG: hypothetical protein HXY27_07280 [Hydrogenophilaceae bacterium]|nr:hypothetical protein [Hydrogenophilaceae bacterium]
MNNIFNAGVLSAVLAAFVLAGCEGVTTGERDFQIPVAASEDGSFGPVLIKLSPDMSPVAINFKAQHGDDPAEIGKWNSYRASLSRNGSVVASGSFNINHSGTIDSPMGATYVTQTMLKVMSPETGEYELHILPLKPVEVTLTHTEIEVRKNIQTAPANP